MLTRPYGAQQPQLLARYPLTDHKVEIIAQFLESFAQDNAGGDDTHTYLEKVGQYLKDEPLVKPVDRSQCGNFMIFLSFRFYMKSILENVEVQKLPFHSVHTCTTCGKV